MFATVAETVPALSASGAGGLDSLVDTLLPAGVGGIAAVFGVLTVLALLDSTSFGTLLIPVWLLMAPGRLRVGRILVYLLVVGGAYAAIGLGLLSLLTVFGDGLFEWFADAGSAPVFSVVQVAIAAGMILLSLRIDPMTKAGKERKRQREEAKAAQGRGTADRVQRFRERAIGEGSQGGWMPLLTLALTAVALEIATLLPYLAGIGLVAATDPGIPIAPAMIVFYCLVMLAPALVLLVGRLVARKALERPLQRIEAFMSRHANGTIGLVLFLLGIWLGVNGLGTLGFGPLG
ncbi:MAG TPA: GAP family protein [Candidatus Agrococcus pullicola]|uniref:GAP family protein n=1 Tax=Candidatus Agrococcus pullicola TaxID=2838429 RepID=A0A9D1YX65_9MICO|nr:GAP family protein [Candidatus Agrococcus pullicola]